MPQHRSPSAPRSPRKHSSIWADFLVLLLVGAVLGGLVLIGQRSVAPYRAAAVIDLSPWSLPRYAALSLSRCFAAYFLSLLFTLVYGSVAAHNPRAQRAMIPALDVLQAIP